MNREHFSNSFSFINLLEGDLRKLVEQCFVEEEYKFGETIVYAGQVSNSLYLILEGKARVVRESETGDEQSLALLTAGDFFGEMSLLSQEPATASVRASSDLVLKRLEGSLLKGLVKTHPELLSYLELFVRERVLHNFLSTNTIFSELDSKNLKLFLDNIEEQVVDPGEIVVSEGEFADCMYIVKSGKLRVLTNREDAEKTLAYLRSGDYFGELAILEDAPRAASVVAETKVELVKLDKETFRLVLEDNPKLAEKIVQRIKEYTYKEVATLPLDFSLENIPHLEEAHIEKEPEPLIMSEKYAAKSSSFDKKSEQLIKKFPFVRQVDEMDCGVACLAMVCQHFGKKPSLAKLRSMLFTNNSGTKLSDLCSAAEDLGLAARSIKASKSRLDDLPLPAITHWDGNHWIVVYRVEKEHVYIADPASGKRKIPREEFLERWTGHLALFDYTIAFESVEETSFSLKWLLPIIKPHYGTLARCAALSLVISLLQLAMPVGTQFIVDTVLVEQNLGLLNLVIFSMMGVMLFMIAASLIQRYLQTHIAIYMDGQVLDALSRTILRLPLSYFKTRRIGDIQRRIEGAKDLRSLLVNNSMSAVVTSVQFVVVMTVMIIYSPLLTCVFLSTVPLYLGLMYLSSKMLKPVFSDIEEGFSRYHSSQIDSIRGIEEVKAKGAEASFREHLLAQFHKMAAKLFKAEMSVMSYEGFLQVISFLSFVLFLWVGAYLVIQGELTIGALMAFQVLISLASSSLMVVLSLWDDYQRATVLCDRLRDVFENEPEQGKDLSRLHPVKSLEGSIKLANVSVFPPGDKKNAILQDVCLEIPAGKRLAIVGRSGSGKTTLVKALAGLIDYQAGQIFYDQVDMSTIRHKDLRRFIGMVLQENHLFDDTIAANIALGDSEPDLERVLWAARIASAADFIERLPLSYETRVGETGVQLSGGQKQRLAIARALYNNPPVLIFDEATSSLDTESERAIKTNLDGLLSGRTSITIAHRLSTIKDADFIIVLEKGRIVEKGTHDELMAREGIYFYLCSQQLAL